MVWSHFLRSAATKLHALLGSGRTMCGLIAAIGKSVRSMHGTKPIAKTNDEYKAGIEGMVI